MGGVKRAVLLAFFVTLALLPGTAQAASTFNVTRFDDPAPGMCDPGDCSLREAIIAANLDPGSTINIPPGRVVLSIMGNDTTALAGDLDINVDMTIKGAGAGATIVDASAIDDRAFEMLFVEVLFSLVCNTPRVVNMSGLTVLGGDGQVADGGGGGKPLGGGAIAVCGTLNVSDSVFTTNSAIGGGAVIIGSSSTVNADRMTISSNNQGSTNGPDGGGGILVQPTATLNLTNSTLNANTVDGDDDPNPTPLGGGGGLLNLGTASLTNVTVTGNSAGAGGVQGFGGGILTLLAGTTTILNSTIASNTAGGGLGGCGGNLGNNLACVPGLGATTLKNTIVAGGSAAMGANCQGGAFASQGNNLDSLDECNFNAAGDLRNTDPRLGPLADNGGPTQTRALLTGSPAINAANNAGCPGADQRGIARPQVLICDIGAFELVFQADLAVTKSAPATLLLGNSLTYTLTITNNGPQPAAGVTLADTIPALAPLVSASLTGNCSGTPFTCVLPDLAPGASTTVTIVTRPRATRSNVNQVLTNTATVSGTYADPNPANNTATATTRLTAPALSSGISGVPTSCRSTNFNIRVTARTTGALSSVRVLLDGRLLTSRKLRSFTVRIPARGLRSGRHTLVVESRGTLGQLSRRTSSFTRCPRPAARRQAPRFTG